MVLFDPLPESESFLSYFIQMMDEASLPHFINQEGSGSSRRSGHGEEQNCYSLDHPFHQQLYNYMKQQSLMLEHATTLYKQGSVHVSVPEPTAEELELAKALESELRKFENGIPMNGLKKISGD